MEVVMDSEENNIFEDAGMFCIKCKTSIAIVNKSDTVFTVYCDKCISILKEERCSRFIDKTKRLLSDCDICLDSYLHMRQLKFHYCTRDRVYNCHDCGQQLDGRKSMIEHSRIVHQEKYFNKFITCYICWERFATSSSFNIHKATHVKNPLSTHESEMAVGNKNSLLDIHKRTKVDERPYKCNTCERNYATKFSLNRHMKTTHDTLYTPFKSTHEGDIPLMNEERCLDNHITTEIDERPYKCSICDSSYLSKFSLNRHIKTTHEKVHLYNCTICNKNLSTESGLVIHIRTHTGEKPHVCNICNKCFAAKSALINHFRIHTGERAYKCSTCDKSFSNKCILDRHVRSHTGERPYSCSTCDKKFSTNSILVVHLRTHTGEKPYKCKICIKEYTNNRSLARHLKTHSNGNS